MLYVLCMCILSSSRIPRYDLGRQTPHIKGVVSQLVSEHMATLHAWECGSHLHGPQKLEVQLHTIGFERETMKMA
jgi:hypothetical protein